MKKTKSNLDELQELKLLKIEHNGCWLAFWGLLAVILTQIAIGNETGSFRRMDRIYVPCFISYSRMHKKRNLGQKAETKF